MFNFRKSFRDSSNNVRDTGLFVTSAGSTVKGDKGRLELYAQVESDGRYSVNYLEVGNYGKVRWEGHAYLTAEQLDEVVAQLTRLRDAKVTSTRVSEAYSPVADTTTTTTERSTAEAVNEDSEDLDSLTA